MIKFLIGIAALFGTIAIYYIATLIYKKFPSPFTLPIITSTFVIILVLIMINVSYETYMLGGEWINKLLGPAVVSLAYPLYQQRETLKKLLFPLLYGVLFGAITGVTTGIGLGLLFQFDEFIIYSLSPKSVTTPVAMVISESLGGPTSLAAVFVMIAGIGGVLMHPFIYKLFRLDHPLGRGVGIGSASHALGTATAMENNQLEGSISTVAMVVSAVIVSVITPLIVAILV